jgi:RNA polymerase sigma-70 factor (ECF subfamily)
MEVSEEDSAATERVQRVMNLVQGLPEKQREIFQLREVEGLTYEEIASYLEISEDQVKVNLHRARKSIREKIQAETK